MGSFICFNVALHSIFFIRNRDFDHKLGVSQIFRFSKLKSFLFFSFLKLKFLKKFLIFLSFFGKHFDLTKPVETQAMCVANNLPCLSTALKLSFRFLKVSYFFTNPSLQDFLGFSQKFLRISKTSAQRFLIRVSYKKY